MFGRKAGIGEITTHKDGTRHKKVGHNKWVQIGKDKKSKKNSSVSKKRKLTNGDIIERNGQSYMKIDTNKFIPMDKVGRKYSVGDGSGLELKKINGKVVEKRFSFDKKKYLHIISNDEIRNQSRDVSHKKISKLEEGTVVRVKNDKNKHGSRGLIARIKEMKNELVTLVDNYGNTHFIPYGRLEFAKSKEHPLQGKIKMFGMDISIENRKSSIRKGVDNDGKEWKTKMLLPYGYIKGTIGADGDHVDVFIGENKKSRLAYVVHIKHPDRNKYDEDKVFLGFDNPDKVKKMFDKHYDRPDRFFESIDEITVEQLKDIVFDKKNKGKKIEL